MLWHVLPNAAAPVIVQITIGLAWTILSEAALTFLGFGAQPPDPSWGAILAGGRKYLTTYPAMSIYPGLAIAISVLPLLSRSLASTYWVMACAICWIQPCADAGNPGENPGEDAGENDKAARPLIAKSPSDYLKT